MKHHKGVGLAAPQVGRSIQLFVADWGDGELVFINPDVVSKTEDVETAEEGCLSVPGKYALIKRSSSIIIEANDIKGNKFKHELSGFPARVAQHELDHLNGILFIDKLSELDSLL